MKDNKNLPKVSENTLPSTSNALKDIAEHVLETTGEAIRAAQENPLAANGAEKSNLPPAAKMTSTIKDIGVQFKKDSNATMQDGIEVISLHSKAEAVIGTVNLLERDSENPVQEETPLLNEGKI